MTQIKYPSKVPLSGGDCFHLMLEKHASKYQAGGNVVRIVFYLDNNKVTQKIIQNINNSPIVHWMCNVKINKGFLLSKPFWEYQQTNRQAVVHEHQLTNAKEIPESIFKRNILVTNPQLIEFDIMYYADGKSAIMLSWNHTLMDGRGAGMLIKHLNDEQETTQDNFLKLFPEKEAHTALFHYIKNMYEVKRFIETSSKAPISNVVKQNNENNQRFKYEVISFTSNETQRIDANAIKHGARFGTNLFLMASCVFAVNALLKKRKKNNQDIIWLPVPYDGRRRGALGPIVNNHVQYLFYRLEGNALSSVKNSLQSLNEQMVAQIKNDMPKKYNTLLNVMRHIPLGLYHHLTNRKSENVFASFLYTSTGENIHDMKTLMTAPIEDVIIFPPQTFPPGITFSFLRHNNALKLNMVYSQNALSNDEKTMMVSTLKSILLETEC